MLDTSLMVEVISPLNKNKSYFNHDELAVF